MVVWWWAVRCPMGRKRLQFSEEFVRKPRVAACFFFQSGCQVACGLCLGVVDCSWVVCGLCLVACRLLLVGRVDCIGWLFGLCSVTVWAVPGGCLYSIGRSLVLLPVVARAVFCSCPGCIIPAVVECFLNMRESPCRIVCCDRGSPLLCCRPRLLHSCRQSSVVAEFCQFTKCPLAL